MGFHLCFTGDVFATSTASISIIYLMLLSRLVLVLLFDLVRIGRRSLSVLLLSNYLFLVLFDLELGQQCMSTFRLHTLSIFDVAFHVSVV